MQRLRAGIAGLVLFSLAAAPSLYAKEPFAVRVLYCGDPSSPRAADFRSFLVHHFTKVTVRDLRDFKVADARDEDVVIIDWPIRWSKNGDIDCGVFRQPRLNVEYVRPTILVAWAGGAVSNWGPNSLKLKIDFLCLCLTGPAHHLRRDHPLFHSPLEVEPKMEEVPTPAEYPYQSIEPLGETITAWKVQTKPFPEAMPGLVSTLYGFTDSPDAEVFAQGFAAKGPDTVALARQANFFLWGFSGSPAEMTPAAQRLFINTVCYMQQFDGQRPLVRNESKSREWALRNAIAPRYLSNEFKARETRSLRAIYTERPEWVPNESKANVEAYIARSVEQMQANQKQAMDDLLPERLRKQFGTDAEKYVAYYRSNFEFLRAITFRPPRFEVDEEAKVVGPSNRRVEFLDRCVTRLEKKDQPERALRLLKRYTNENFETAGKWHAWLDQNRSRLFFSDVGGYKFFVAPEKKSSTENRLTTKR
jgi:hypothetical protein